MAPRLMRLDPADNVAVALARIPAGERLELDGIELTAGEEVPMAHKVALVPIAAGAKVRKFGVPIGSATRDIGPGELVHVHNLQSDYLVNDVDHHED